MSIVVLPKLTGSQTADTSASASTLALRDANGALTVAALIATDLQAAVGAYTASHAIGAETFLNGNATGGAVTFTLPIAANVPGKFVVAKKTDSSGNAVILAAGGSDTIDGAASKSTSTQYAVIRAYSDGAVWWTF